MWLDMFKGFTEVPIGYPVRFNLAKEHYQIKFEDPTYFREIEYEKFDYNIIPPVDENNPYANGLVNEPWVFFRMLWKIRGGFNAVIHFNPEIDQREFGDSYGACLYTGIYKFSITKEGKWTADFYTKFDQIDNPLDNREPPPKGRRGPFYAQDYSRIQANTAKRARKLAKPTWSEDEGRSDVDFNELLQEEEYLNKTVDWSFEHSYQGTGDWGNYKTYEVEVSNTSSTVIPEKEAMTSKESKSIATFKISDIAKRKFQEQSMKLPEPKLPSGS
jgi:hypothetical protein